MFLNYLEQKFEYEGILKDCVLKIILAKSKFSFIKHLKNFFAVDEYLLFPQGEYLSFPLTRLARIAQYVIRVPIMEYRIDEYDGKRLASSKLGELNPSW